MVIKAKHRLTGRVFAIKHIQKPFKNAYKTKQVLREIQILRHLTQMEENVHTTKLYDILHSDDLKDIFLVIDYMKTDLR